jgi:LAO/AO transport system kinase
VARTPPEKTNATNEVDHLVRRLKEGEDAALARVLTLIESASPASRQILEHLSALELARVPVIGVTGPPGSGKSTLVGRLVAALVGRGQRVGVIAVDPSSARRGGAVLGDRVRMTESIDESRVFVRSMAARGALGGVSLATRGAILALRAARFDAVIVETVGVGQGELDIATIASTLVLVHTPESGDEVQGVKVGLNELADIHVLNKADLDGAEIAHARLVDMLAGFSAASTEKPVVIEVVARSGAGIEDLLAAIDRHEALGAEHSPDRLSTTSRLRIELARSFEQALVQPLAQKIIGRVASGELEITAALRELVALVGEQLEKRPASDDHR